MTSRSHGRRSRRRVPSNSASKRSLLVFTEGVTEQEYLTLWAREHREKVVVEFDPRTGYEPLPMVRLAKRARADSLRDANRGRGSAYDSVWCVFDVDDHPYIPEAKQLAASSGVQTAISNPCFELWLILHFHDQFAHFDRHQAHRAILDAAGVDIHIPARVHDDLLAGYDDAVRRASQLAAGHVTGGLADESNPSSGVWRLVDEIRRA